MYIKLLENTYVTTKIDVVYKIQKNVVNELKEMLINVKCSKYLRKIALSTISLYLVTLSTVALNVEYLLK